MFKKNRIWKFAVAATVGMGLLTGCGSATTNDTTSDATETGAMTADQSEKLRVVCTIFPEYDWAREVIGNQSNQYELTLLLENGGDLHNYQPTAEDIAKIADCDLFIYVGGESDSWVEDALQEAVNPNMQVVNLLEVLGDTVKEEELVEGMQHDHDHESSETEDDHESSETEDDHDHESTEMEYDEHVWLSLKNASVLVNSISTALQTIDPINAEEYKTNSDAYTAKLAELDTEYQTTIDDASKDTIVLADRFPFRYLVDDYGLNYYAAFAGCSAETEASFETVVFLAEKMDELDLDYILVIENSDQKIAQTVVGNTKTKDQEILVLNSLQSVTAKDVAEGITYLAVMQENRNVLEKALNEVQ